jgi:hypothetical protein
LISFGHPIFMFSSTVGPGPHGSNPDPIFGRCFEI